MSEKKVDEGETAPETEIKEEVKEEVHEESNEEVKDEQATDEKGAKDEKDEPPPQQERPSFIVRMKSRFLKTSGHHEESKLEEPRVEVEEEPLAEGIHPLQLYSDGTANGQQITCALELMELQYDATLIEIPGKHENHARFRQISPHGKIPALVDKEGPSEEPMNLFESGSILLYLAEKFGKLLPADPALKVECINWLFFQVGSAPYFGQFVHFFEPSKQKIKYCIERYTVKSKKFLKVLDDHLVGKDFIVGNEITIADIAWLPWIVGLEKCNGAKAQMELDKYKEINRWKVELLKLPGIENGMSKLQQGRVSGIQEL